MNQQDVLMSSKSEHWCTPECILEPTRRLAEGSIALDPCSNAHSTVGAVTTLMAPMQDGLAADWTQLASGGLVFVNFPYGRKSSPEWVAKIREEAEKGCEILVLAPARTETKWFQKAVEDYQGSKVSAIFLSGRLKFIEGLTGKKSLTAAPFPSVLLYYGERQYKFLTEFTALGKYATFV